MVTNPIKMRTIKLSFGIAGLLAVLMLTFFAACKKEDPNKNLDAQRLFKPAGISIKTTQTTARATWSAPVLSKNLKLSYQVEFSQDSTFATSEFSVKTDTLGVTVTDEKIAVRQKYYLRVKALATASQPESEWLVSSSFTITGEQLFLPTRELEILETQITLRWKPTTGLDKITLTPAGGAVVSYDISSAEATLGVKVITGLTAGINYSAEIYQGTRSKGILKISTPAPTVYTKILDPGADLVAEINAAANNAVIGLRPGTYSAGTANFILLQKTITIKSTSGNPLDTKVNYKEVDLKGTGAGINFSGIELDGTASGSLYFINPVGLASDGEKAAFTQVSVVNCIVHGSTTSFMRANRGSAAGDHSIESITVRNCIIYDMASTLGYAFLHLDKLQFGTLNVTKTTMYNIGRQLLSCSTVLPTPPAITFDYCTLNNFGSNALNVLMDANANPVRLTMTNNIIGNIPRAGATVAAVAIRASGAGSVIVFSYNNTFNFTNGSGAVLTLPATNTSQAGNQSINPGWTAGTTTFTLPQNSPLMTASSAGAPIGDPRWTY